MKNRLERLPDSLGGLAGLRRLDLESNRLTQLPESLGCMTGLTDLNLRFNQLTSLPESVGSFQEPAQDGLAPARHKPAVPHGLAPRLCGLCALTNLRFLDLRANRLASIPDSLAKLRSLEKLDLRWNRLRTLPAVLSRLRARGCVIYA